MCTDIYIYFLRNHKVIQGFIQDFEFGGREQNGNRMIGACESIPPPGKNFEFYNVNYILSDCCLIPVTKQ